MDGLDYTKCLKELKMYSMQRRHERLKIIYQYKIKKKESQTYLVQVGYHLAFMVDMDANIMYQTSLLEEEQGK